MFVFKAAVVGAGTVGAEIARAIAAAGVAVVLKDVDQRSLDTALARMRELSGKRADEILARIRPTLSYAELGDVDFVVEAVPERMDVKHAVFAELDAFTPGHAVLASTTSGLSITEISDATGRPDRVVGFHLLQPASSGRLVEVVEGDETSAETVQAAAGFAQAIRKTPVRCAEGPGFVVARVLTALRLDGSGAAGINSDPRLGERPELLAFAEACAILEEGVAGVGDVDLALALGAGMSPGPFLGADRRGLDAVLAAMEAAEAEWGEAFAPPPTLRRLVNQGRLGAESGQGFYPYPRPDAGYEEALVKLETRGEIAVVWLADPPANSLSPAVVEALAAVWAAVEARGATAMVLASANPGRFCAGADIKAFAKMDGAAARALVERVHALLRAWERSRVMTVAAVDGLALGGGCELAMACDVRVAAASATFGQPEVNLGIVPGFGGTQRLPRLVGVAKALEMNLTGEPIAADDAFAHGLVNRVVADHELFDAALAWARRLAGQAPVAVEQIKRVSARGDLDEGIAAEKEAFMTAFASEDAREGLGAFVAKRPARWQGR